MSIPIEYPYVFFLLFMRFTGFMVSAPILSQRTFPVLGKITLAGLLAFLMAPVAPAATIPENDLILFTLVAQELLLGVLLGFVAMLPFLGIDAVGRFIASAMGFNYGTSVSPLLPETTPPLGQLYFQFSLLLFITVNGDQAMFLALKHLVDLLPPGFLLSEMMTVSGQLLVDRILFMTTRFWLVGMQLALPVIGVILLSDVGLALISRAMPRMNAFSISLALKVLMGLTAMLLGFPYLWPQILREVDRVGQQMILLFR